jgi:predicted membrane channel-forming protein YqfA (hemolysin III family)
MLLNICELIKASYGPIIYLSLEENRSFWQVMLMVLRKIQADLTLVDIVPNLKAINRSMLPYFYVAVLWETMSVPYRLKLRVKLE